VHWNFSEIIVNAKERFSAKGGPMSVEIGFGNGEFLQFLASSRPDSLAIGIEVSQWCISKASRRALANGLKNIRILCGDARHLLKHAFEPASVNEVFMNFPCPWPKRRHSGRRVSGDDFAGLLAVALAPGGTFILATDVGWYALQAHEAFARHAAFDAEKPERNGTRAYATKYERKWRAMGRDIFELKATKKAGFVPEHTETEVDWPMEEIETSRASGDFRERVAGLRGETVDGAGYKAIFLEAYWNGENDALVKVISIDEGFEQHYYLRIALRDGRLRVTPDSVGHPYKTPAVRASIRHAAQKATLYS
jgi:tRNA (guanine-N7-)-methyltransferase